MQTYLRLDLKMGQFQSVEKEKQQEIHEDQENIKIDIQKIRVDNDPRSPNGNIRRTPIRFLPKYGSTYVSLSSSKRGGTCDPRSPNKEIQRTPIRSSTEKWAEAKEIEVVPHKLFPLQDDKDRDSREPLSTKN